MLRPKVVLCKRNGSQSAKGMFSVVELIIMAIFCILEYSPSGNYSIPCDLNDDEVNKAENEKSNINYEPH